MSLFSSASALAAPQPGRLDDAVVPTAQSLRLEVDPAEAGYAGTTTIRLEVKRTAATFAFHARGLALESLRLDGPRGAIAARHAPGGHGLVVVTTEAPLAPGRYTLRIEFRNDFDTRAESLYRVKAGDDWYAFTKFEPDDARRAFPCWDEPSFKIPFQVTAVVPEGAMAISNTLVRTERLGDGRRTVVFRATPPLPTYLVALMVGPFDLVPIPGTSIPARVVTVKGQGTLAAEAARITPPLLAALEKYFGRRHPFEKLDLVAVPEFLSGAMENPGAITYRDTILLMDPARTDPARRRRLIEVTAHEIAHMWFGNLVTMAWWDDLWLNEAFASWMGDTVAGQVFPELRTGVGGVRDMERALVRDARLSTRAVRHPVSALDDLRQSFDPLAYDKGRAVLAMVESWIGAEAFRRGVIDYLAAHEWGNATAADLFASLGRASGRDVAGLLATFLDQPGLPLVTAELREGGRVRLSQRRLLPAGAPAPAATWRVPVGLRFSDGRTVQVRTVLLTEPAQEVALDVPRVEWLYPNAGQLGYYRWAVPEPERLVGIAGPSLTVHERVGTVGNLGALLEAGLLAGDAYLRLLSRLAADPEPEPVAEVVRALGAVRNTFVDAGNADAFAAFVRAALRPALDRIGLTPRPGEPEGTAVLRPQLLVSLGIDGRDPAVREQATAWARAFLADPRTVDAAVAPAALEVAASAGGPSLFEEFRRAFEAAALPADRQSLLGALGAFREPGAVEQALAYAREGPLRPQERLVIPLRVLASTEHADRPLAWYRESYEVLKDRLPERALVTAVRLAGGCSPPRVDTARAFFSDPARQRPGMERELERLAEEVRHCVALRDREGARVTAVLREAP